MAHSETSLEGWVPEPGGHVSLARVIDLAFDYRGNTTVVKRDGSEVAGYIFNRNTDVPQPFIQMFDADGAGPFRIPYSEIVTIKFDGKDTAAGNSYAAWLGRKAADRDRPAAGRPPRVRRLLVLTAVEREARELARRLGLARVASTPWPHFATPPSRDGVDLGAGSRPGVGSRPGAGSSSRGRFTAPNPRRPRTPRPRTSRPRTPIRPDLSGAGLELMSVGLRAGLLDARWPAGQPPFDLVVSAGLCGALSPGLGRGDLVLPSVVLDGGESLAVAGPAHAEALASAARAGYVTRTDPVVTVTEVVASPEAKALLRRDTGAAAVDLESAAIVRAARDRGLPALVIRGVSDTAEQALEPELARVVNPAGRVRVAFAIRLALRRPGLIRDALELHRGATAALESVAAVLRNFRKVDLECPTR
jgi:adenosylhomocysteine nucleosidase